MSSRMNGHAPEQPFATLLERFAAWNERGRFTLINPRMQKEVSGKIEKVVLDPADFSERTVVIELGEDTVIYSLVKNGKGLVRSEEKPEAAPPGLKRLLFKADEVTVSYSDIECELFHKIGLTVMTFKPESG